MKLKRSLKNLYAVLIRLGNLLRLSVADNDNGTIGFLSTVSCSSSSTGLLVTTAGQDSAHEHHSLSVALLLFSEVKELLNEGSLNICLS